MAKTEPRLSITVQPDGTVTTDFLQFVGPTCLAAGRQLHALLAELGIESEETSFTPKPELSAPCVNEQVSTFQESLQEGGSEA
jgi:hypothetical protein